MGISDKCFRCVVPDDCDKNKVSVSQSENLMARAGDVRSTNFATLGSLALSLSEWLLFFAVHVARKVLGAKTKTPIPGLNQALKLLLNEAAYNERHWPHLSLVLGAFSLARGESSQTSEHRDSRVWETRSRAVPAREFDESGRRIDHSLVRNGSPGRARLALKGNSAEIFGFFGGFSPELSMRGESELVITVHRVQSQNRKRLALTSSHKS